MNTYKYDKQQPGIDRLKQAWDENPMLVIGVATGACMAVAKLIEAISSIQGRRAYARQVNLSAKRPAKTTYRVKS